MAEEFDTLIACKPLKIVKYASESKLGFPILLFILRMAAWLEHLLEMSHVEFQGLYICSTAETGNNYFKYRTA